MFGLKFIYPVEKSQEYKEVITYAATVDLFEIHHIHTVQTSASVLEFETDKDRMFASMLLASNTAYKLRLL